MCENDGPNTLSIVAGDFSQSNLVGIMPVCKQCVKCPSRNNRILDHCYCKVKKANKSVSRSSYSDADHATIISIPSNKLMLKCCIPKTKTVNVWMPEAIERLQDCF